MKFSPDGYISDQTISTLSIVRAIFFIASTLFLIIILITLYNKKQIQQAFGKRKIIIQNILILLFVILFFIVAAEIILRIVYHEHTTRHGSSPGSIAFNKKYFTLNSEGMRDYEFSIEKEDDKTRIIGLGD